jgi:hypothetical protein
MRKLGHYRISQQKVRPWTSWIPKLVVPFASRCSVSEKLAWSELRRKGDAKPSQTLVICLMLVRFNGSRQSEGPPTWVRRGKGGQIWLWHPHLSRCPPHWPAERTALKTICLAAHLYNVNSIQSSGYFYISFRGLSDGTLVIHFVYRLQAYFKFLIMFR